MVADNLPGGDEATVKLWNDRKWCIACKVFYDVQCDIPCSTYVSISVSPFTVV